MRSIAPRLSVLKFKEFLLLEEFSETRDVKSKTPGQLGNVGDKTERLGDNSMNGILANSVTAKWNPEDDSNAIGDITFEIKKGQCYGICGSVGDGKVNYGVLVDENCIFGLNTIIIIGF